MKVICNIAKSCKYKQIDWYVCPHGKEHEHENPDCRCSCVCHVVRGDKEGADSRCTPIT